MSNTLTSLDATFLELEELDAGAVMSIGGTMVFDPLPDGGAPAIGVVRAHLAGRFSRLPRYSQRLSSTRVGDWSWPHWTADESFDIRNHVYHEALPAPGSEVSSATGPPTSSRTRSTGRGRCGRWSFSRGSRAGAGRSDGRPTIASSTGSARST